MKLTHLSADVETFQSGSWSFASSLWSEPQTLNSHVWSVSLPWHATFIGNGNFDTACKITPLRERHFPHYASINCVTSFSRFCRRRENGIRSLHRRVSDSGSAPTSYKEQETNKRLDHWQHTNHSTLCMIMFAHANKQVFKWLCYYTHSVLKPIR